MSGAWPVVGRGATAGALATLALNVVTYADVTLRGRPPSPVPAEVVDRTTAQLGVTLAAGGRRSGEAANRRTGLGALLGYATGISAGVAYGLARRRFVGPPAPLAGLVAGAAVMAMTDVSATAAGATDPRCWGASGWLADIVPHAVFGVVLGVSFDRLADRTPTPLAGTGLPGRLGPSWSPTAGFSPPRRSGRRG